MTIAFISLLIIAAIGIASIFADRAHYKNRVMGRKLRVAINKYKCQQTYWYNSTKGFIQHNYPSCWATVQVDPYLKKKKVVADVKLKTPTGVEYVTVPIESLSEITQLNS